MLNNTRFQYLEAQNFGRNNTCSETMLSFISQKVLEKPLTFDFKGSKNDYQIDLGDIVTPFTPGVPMTGSTLVNQPNPAVQANIFYSGEDAEVKGFLKTSSSYFVRTGTNGGGGHWSALYYDKDRSEWMLRSSDNGSPEVIIKNGEFEKAAIESIFIGSSNSKEQGNRGQDARSLFMIEANKNSIAAAVAYVRAFRKKVLKENASNAGTKAVSDYARENDIGIVEPAPNIPDSAEGLEAEHLITQASQKIQSSSECQKFISEWQPLASPKTSQSLISINLDPILFPAGFHRKEKPKTEDEFLKLLANLDKKKSYFVRCGRSEYDYEKEKPSLQLFYYDHDKKGWISFRDNMNGRLITSEEGVIDDTIKGNYVNDRESYLGSYHCAFLEITSEILDKAARYIGNFRIKTREFKSLSEYKKSDEFKQKVEDYIKDKKSNENEEEELQNILREAAATDDQLVAKDKSLTERICKQNDKPIEVIKDEKRIEEVLKNRRDSISKQARKEARQCYLVNCDKSANSLVINEYRVTYYQRLKSVYSELIQQANTPVVSASEEEPMASETDRVEVNESKLSSEQLAWKQALEEAEEAEEEMIPKNLVKKAALASFRNSFFFTKSLSALTETEANGKSYVLELQRKEINYYEKKLISENSSLDLKSEINFKKGDFRGG